MWKPLTGEPYAGDPPVRFGGRGGQKTFPTPIVTCLHYQLAGKFRARGEHLAKPHERPHDFYVDAP